MKTSTVIKKEKPRAQNRGQVVNPALELALFAIIQILIFSLLYHTIYKDQYSGTGLYFDYASKVLHGSLPYRDFTLEYPPFALFFFILPRLVASTYPVFVIVYQAEVIIFVLIGLYIIYLTARRLGKAPWKLMTVYTICILAMGPIVGQQYDIFPAVLTLLAIFYFWVGEHDASWALLTLGTLTKFFPAVIAPIFWLYYLKNRQYKKIALSLLVFAIITLVIVAPFLILGSESIINLIKYHAQRGIQLESTYSAFLLLANLLGLLSPIHWVFNYGSVNLSGPAADFLAKASTYIAALGLLLTYWFIWGQIKPGKSQFTRLGAYSVLAIDVLLITSKVLSPQYLIWLVPLAALLFGPWRYHLTAIFAIIGMLTYFIFPVGYIALELFQTDAIILLLMRDILLILLAILITVSLRRMKSSD